MRICNLHYIVRSIDFIFLCMYLVPSQYMPADFNTNNITRNNNYRSEDTAMIFSHRRQSTRFNWDTVWCILTVLVKKLNASHDFWTFFIKWNEKKMFGTVTNKTNLIFLNDHKSIREYNHDSSYFEYSKAQCKKIFRNMILWEFFSPKNSN